MGKYGNQRSWGHKDTAKDGGSKTENVRGAQNNNKTERPRGRWWQPPHAPGVGAAWAGGEDTYLERISYV